MKNERNRSIWSEADLLSPQITHTQVDRDPIFNEDNENALKYEMSMQRQDQIVYWQDNISGYRSHVNIRGKWGDSAENICLVLVSVVLT